MRRLGIDPAPGKGLVVFDPEPVDHHHFRHVPASCAREWLATQREAHPDLLVGWDAPLFADFTSSYTERPIETLLKRTPRQPGLGPAVSVRGYGGCPHWTISIDVLGHPLPWSVEASGRLPLVFPGDDLTGGGVVETHPAVALAMLWPSGDLPVYKGSPRAEAKAGVDKITSVLRERCEAVFGVGFVELPADARETVTVGGGSPRGIGMDDLLDAQVSYLCVAAMERGKAILLGDRWRGGFVVARTEKALAWQARYEERFFGAGPA